MCENVSSCLVARPCNTAPFVTSHNSLLSLYEQIVTHQLEIISKLIVMQNYVRLHLCVCPTLYAGHMIDHEYEPNEVVGVFGLRLGAVCRFPAAFEWVEVQAVSWSGLSEPTVGSVAGQLVTKQQVLIVFIDVNWNFCFHKLWSSLSFEPGWKVLNKMQLMNYWKWQKVEQTWNFQAVLVVYDEIFLLWLQLP